MIKMSIIHYEKLVLALKERIRLKSYYPKAKVILKSFKKLVLVMKLYEESIMV